MSKYLVWHVDPASGVRPRLPDRSELSSDDCLKNAAHVIVDTLVSHYYAMVQAAAKDFPDRIDHSEIWKLSKVVFGENLNGYGKFIIEAVLPSLGWKHVDESVFDRLSVYYIDEIGFEMEESFLRGWDRNAPEVAEPHLALTLANLGTWVSRTSSAQKREITFHGLRISGKHPQTSYEKERGLPPRDISPHIALAERIEVEDFGDLPYLISLDQWDHPELDVAGVTIVFAGTPSELSTALGNDFRFIHAILCSESDDIYDALYDDWWDWTHEGLNYDTIIKDLRMQITQAFAPELLVVRAQFYAMEKVVGGISSLRSKTRGLASHAGAIGSLRSRMWRPFFIALRWVLSMAHKAAAHQLGVMKIAAEL